MRAADVSNHYDQSDNNNTYKPVIGDSDKKTSPNKRRIRNNTKNSAGQQPSAEPVYVVSKEAKTSEATVLTLQREGPSSPAAISPLSLEVRLETETRLHFKVSSFILSSSVDTAAACTNNSHCAYHTWDTTL